MSPTFPRLFCVLLCAGAAAYGQSSISGFVTYAGTPQRFEVNGTVISCAPDGPHCPQHTFGEHLTVEGKWDTTSQTYKTHSFNSLASEPKHPPTISGLAVIDKLLASDLVRADGYALRLTADTRRDWNEPLTSASPLALHQWIGYRGTLGKDGVITLQSAILSTSYISPAEQKLRQKNEFEPSAVTEDQRQGWASKSFKGVDYRRTPAAKNPEQQSRLERIGNRLVPSTQRALTPDDPALIHFRFQVVNADWMEAYGLPSGIVLVPERVCLRLNDDELAAVVANSMAGVIEKQQARFAPTFRNLGVADIASLAGEFFVPGIGLATNGSTGIAGEKINKRLEQQECRLSLTLLADAGFDLQQAPMAWWKLASKESDESLCKTIPRRTTYLFSILATEWGPHSPLREPPLVTAKAD